MGAVIAHIGLKNVYLMSVFTSLQKDSAIHL